MEKLIQIQNQLNAPKNQRNTFGGYNYRSAEDILEALKPLLHTNKCALTLKDDIVLVGDRFYIKAIATLLDENGAEIANTVAFAREPLSKKGMDDSQITGTASSYARKYALNGLFCIDDNKDADTDEYHEQTKSDTAEEKPSVADIVAGINSKMTLDNWKGFYKRAIDLYPKGTADYKTWSSAFNARKESLESEQTQKQLQSDSDYVNNI